MLAVRDKTFEGPLDLLLSLIEKEKLDICKISLAKITNSYLGEIQKIDTSSPCHSRAGGNPDISASSNKIADFLIVASKLLYLKSQAVLPLLSPEEEEEIEDLETQLKEYKKFKELSLKFAEIIDKKQRSFEPGVRNFQTDLFLPPVGVDLAYLMNVLNDVLKRMPKEEKKEEKKIEANVTLEEKLEQLQTLIKKNKKFSFHSIIKKSRNRGEVIVTFLALLEMIKRKAVKVSQSKNFGDLTVQGI